MSPRLIHTETFQQKFSLEEKLHELEIPEIYLGLFAPHIKEFQIGGRPYDPLGIGDPLQIDQTTRATVAKVLDEKERLLESHVQRAHQQFVEILHANADHSVDVGQAKVFHASTAWDKIRFLLSPERLPPKIIPRLWMDDVNVRTSVQHIQNYIAGTGNVSLPLLTVIEQEWKREQVDLECFSYVSVRSPENDWNANWPLYSMYGRKMDVRRTEKVLKTAFDRINRYKRRVQNRELHEREIHSIFDDAWALDFWRMSVIYPQSQKAGVLFHREDPLEHAKHIMLSDWPLDSSEAPIRGYLRFRKPKNDYKKRDTYLQRIQLILHADALGSCPFEIIATAIPELIGIQEVGKYAHSKYAQQDYGREFTHQQAEIYANLANNFVPIIPPSYRHH